MGVGRGSILWKYCKEAVNAELVAICDKWEQGLEKAKKEIGDDRITYYTDFEEFIKHGAPEEISYCVAVPPESEGEYIQKIQALKAISFFHHGAYEEIGAARSNLISYAEENNMKLSGVFRNLYLEGPPQHNDKSKFITQIIAIIE